MASLTSLYNTLNYWKGQVNALNDEIRKLKKRRSDVGSIKSSLRSTVNNNSNDVNGKLRSVIDKFDRAIDYSGKNSQLNAILSGKNELTIGSDNNITSTDGELQRELNDVDHQIGEAESSLATAKRKVSDTQAAISAEKRRQREQAAHNAAKA